MQTPTLPVIDVRSLFIDYDPSSDHADDGIGCYPFRLRPVSRDEDAYFTFMSDLHLEANHAKRGLIKAELERALYLHNQGHISRVNINGDLVDLILPGDRKRYRPSVMMPELLGCDNPLDKTIEIAVDFLSPYAHLIDVIGAGNHEESCEKYNNSNARDRIVAELNRRGGSIASGQYQGYIIYRMVSDNPKAKAATSYTIYYNHGRAGGEVTEGRMEFKRKAAVFEGADAIWLGHNHYQDESGSDVYCPNNTGNIVKRGRKHIRTASYFAYGKALYASKAGFTPQPSGGDLGVMRITTKHSKLLFSTFYMNEKFSQR